LGLNTGIADSHNLIWKISAVEKGWASLFFLQTYTDERRPVALANARQSAKNQKMLFKLFHFATDPRTALVTVEAWEDKAHHDRRAAIEQAIQDNREHFDSINLQIGYVYGGDQNLSKGERCDVYQPSCVPGARLPHAWIRYRGKLCSSLDLIDGTAFVILASDNFNLGQKTTRVPVKIQRIGTDFTVEQGGSPWAGLIGIDTGCSGVLVRPDQHIVGRVNGDCDIDALLSFGSAGL